MATSNRREREMERRRLERQAQRRAQARANSRQRTAVIAGIVAVALVAGGFAYLWIRGGSDTATVAADSPTPSPGTSAAAGNPSSAPSATTAAFDGTCTYTRAGKAARNVGVPPTKPPVTSGTQVVTLNTNLGDVTVGLKAGQAPCTVNSFRYLAEKGYFTGTSCHRLTTQGIFVLQCGDPTGTGSGGPGYQFPDENLKGATYPAGTLAMANAGPGTNGSQFFIVYKDTPLPPQYTPFGVVRGGLDIVQGVAAAGATPPDDGKPNKTITITGTRVGTVEKT